MIEPLLFANRSAVGSQAERRKLEEGTAPCALCGPRRRLRCSAPGSPPAPVRERPAGQDRVRRSRRPAAMSRLPSTVNETSWLVAATCADTGEFDADEPDPDPLATPPPEQAASPAHSSAAAAAACTTRMALFLPVASGALLGSSIRMERLAKSNGSIILRGHLGFISGYMVACGCLLRPSVGLSSRAHPTRRRKRRTDGSLRGPDPAMQ